MTYYPALGEQASSRALCLQGEAGQVAVSALEGLIGPRLGATNEMER
jgi:hypothetical protein